MKSVFRIIQFVLIFSIVTAIFFFFWENSQEVRVKFFSWVSPTHPLATSLMLSFVAGFLFSSLYFLVEIIKTKNVCRRYRKENATLQKQVDQLRNEPIEKPEKYHDEKSQEDTFSSRSWSAALETNNGDPKSS